MAGPSDFAGVRFGRLTGVRREKSDARGQARWLWQCDCGAAIIVRGTDVRRGNTRSCGCIKREIDHARFLTHGKRRTSLYDVWCAIKQRCSNPNHRRYKDYGGRGIGLWPEWLRSFTNFSAYVDANLGACPSGMSLDRIDNDGSYQPGNIRWATHSQQRANRRAA